MNLPSKNLTHEHVDDIDLLITRLIDGEAGDDLIAQFSDAVRRNPELGVMLAARQRDFSLLAGAVRSRLSEAESIRLPPDAARAPGPGAAVIGQISVFARLRPLLAYSGWAAAIVVAVLAAALRPSAPSDIEFVDFEAVAPHIIEDREGRSLDPVLLHSERLLDGRWKIILINRTMREVIADDFRDAWIEERSATDAGGGGA